MPIDFARSETATIGVEWELALVERDGLGLSSRAPELVASLDPELRGSIRGEYLASMVELVTGVHDRVDDAVAELRSLLGRVLEAADRLELEVLATGTHPFTRGEDVPVVERAVYETVRERNAWWGRRMTICGTHVHFGLAERDAALPLVSGLADAAPLLIALSASSAFYEGEDTGFASQRTMLFQQLATNGLPPQLPDWPAFEARVAELAAAGIAATAHEIRWDVRPAPAFGTVETRVADASPTLAEVGCLVAWNACLAAELIEALERGERPRPLPRWARSENKWRAARYGLEAELITADGLAPLRDELERGLDRLAPIAERLGCEHELGFARTLLRTGTSADRQREVASRAGGDLRAVVAQAAAETRACS